MGDTSEGSSAAALGAQDESESRPAGLFGRLIGALSPGEDEDGDLEIPALSGDPVAMPPPGMLNLRRMRVEDVMLPKAEIVSVSEDISKDDLVEIFRSSGLTRLPHRRVTIGVRLGPSDAQRGLGAWPAGCAQRIELELEGDLV